MVSNCKGLGVHLSNIASEVVESLANSIEGEFEVVSTDDARARLGDFNEKQRRTFIYEEIKLLPGADAVALFPSLYTK